MLCKAQQWGCCEVAYWWSCLGVQRPCTVVHHGVWNTGLRVGVLLQLKDVFSQARIAGHRSALRMLCVVPLAGKYR
jgi:hypothetical protein